MNIDKYIILLKEIAEFRKKINRLIKFDKKDKKHLYLVFFNIRILELVESILALYNNHLYASIPIIFRSIFEAFVDFENLYKDPDYINYLDIEYYVEWEKLFKSSELGNPFLTTLSKPSSQILKSQILNSEFDELRTKGYKKLRNEDKIKKAVESAVYYSVYNFACGESHNDLRTLFDWNTNVSQDKSFNVECFSQNNERLLPYLDATSAMFLNSIKSLLEFLKVSIDDNYEKLVNNLETLRKCV
jgi:hypothetical protein